MLVIICARYGKNLSWIVHAVERTWQEVQYFNSFITKWSLIDLEGIG